MNQLFYADTRRKAENNFLSISYIPKPSSNIKVKEQGFPHQRHFYSSLVISLRWSTIIIYAIISPCLVQKYFKKYRQTLTDSLLKCMH